jgi:hypothetical protein
MTHQEFIEAVAKGVKKYAPAYGIKVHSPIIAIDSNAWSPDAYPQGWQVQA